MSSLLQVDNLVAGHGLLQAVREVSLSVSEGEVLALVGANGAGKSTLLRTISGAHPAARGVIRLDGLGITDLPPHRRVARGLVLVPEGRKLFPEMTVEENLLVAGRRARPGQWTIDAVLNAQGGALTTAVEKLRVLRAGMLAHDQTRLKRTPAK